MTFLPFNLKIYKTNLTIHPNVIILYIEITFKKKIILILFFYNKLI